MRELEDVFDRDAHAPEAVHKLEIEFANIQDGQKWAAENFRNDPRVAAVCSRYGDSAPGLMEIFTDSREMREMQRQWLRDALSAACQLGYVRAQSAHLDRLAMDAFDRGDTLEALQLALDAVERANQSRDLSCQATAIGNCGHIYARLQKYPEAESAYRHALSLFQQLGDYRAAQNTLTHLALLEKKRADHIGTPVESGALIENIERSLAEAQKSGDLESERRWLDILAQNLTEADPARAGELCERAQVLSRKLGNAQGEASATGVLAKLADQAGDTVRNITLLKHQLAILDLHPDPDQEAVAHLRLAAALSNSTSMQESVEHAKIAFKLFSRMQSPHASLASAITQNRPIEIT